MSRVAASKSQKTMPSLLTVDDVADLLSFDRQTVWRWAREGPIPCYKISNQFRFRPDEIEKWVEKRRQKYRLLHPQDDEFKAIEALGHPDPDSQN